MIRGRSGPYIVVVVDAPKSLALVAVREDCVQAMVLGGFMTDGAHRTFVAGQAAQGENPAEMLRQMGQGLLEEMGHAKAGGTVDVVVDATDDLPIALLLAGLTAAHAARTGRTVTVTSSIAMITPPAAVGDLS